MECSLCSEDSGHGYQHCPGGVADLEQKVNDVETVMLKDADEPNFVSDHAPAELWEEMHRVAEETSKASGEALCG